MSKSVNYQDVLYKILKIWVVCYGAITLQVVAGYFMSHILLPYIGFLLILMVIWMGKKNLSEKSAINCSLLTHYTVYALAVSGVIMLIANLMTTNFISNRYSEFSHQNYPFHASFIVYPVAAVMYFVAMLRRGHPQYCKACRGSAEFSVAESLRRNVLHHEAKIQVRMAFGISLLLTVVTYVYYFTVYRSGVSFRRFGPDIFFMYILPAIVYGLSVIYVLSRFFSLEMEVSVRSSAEDNSRTSHIRYMVVWRDRLLLKDIVGDGLSNMWDTPADVSIPYVSEISMHQAETAFRKLYGEAKFSLKRLFASVHKSRTCLHCAAFLDDEDEKVNAMEGEWFALRDVDMMLQMGIIARPFAVELHRVFTITMAWKTYDRDGRRLYPIKNYRPTFRLRDFKDWTVDYEDLHWMSVAQNNQDKPFYNWRRFWNRLFAPSEKKWQNKNS